MKWGRSYPGWVDGWTQKQGWTQGTLNPQLPRTPGYPPASTKRALSGAKSCVFLLCEILASPPPRQNFWPLPPGARMSGWMDWWTDAAAARFTDSNYCPIHLSSGCRVPEPASILQIYCIQSAILQLCVPQQQLQAQ